MKSGVKFPIALDMPRHNIACTVSCESIRESVRLILLTRKGERILHPGFGSRLHEYVFENANQMTESMICAEVTSALRKWEERIDTIEVRTTPAENTLVIDISYMVIETGTRDTIRVEVKG